MERIDRIKKLSKGGIDTYQELTEICGLNETEIEKCIKLGEKNKIVISIKGEKDCDEYYEKFVSAQYWPRSLKAIVFKNMEAYVDTEIFEAHVELKFSQYNVNDEMLHVVQMLVSEIDDEYVEKLCNRIDENRMRFDKFNYGSTEQDEKLYLDYLGDVWDNYDPYS